MLYKRASFSQWNHNLNKGTLVNNNNNDRLYVGPRLPGEPEPKHLKFEHMLKAGEALAATKGEVNTYLLIEQDTPLGGSGTGKWALVGS